MKENKDGGKTQAWLLWGDHVRVVQTSGAFANVKARATQGWVPRSVLGDEGLLELYVIDVGQGDGVLMRTPDDRWHVVDAGVENDAQMTKKGMANFIRWKFLDDLGKQKVRLENVILSHPDFDHYGGMIDLFLGKVQRPDREFVVEVENFYHCGMGRFKKDYGEDEDVTIRVLGPIVEHVNGTAGLRVFNSESVTRNGHSIVLRVEYGKTRVLLTGDLNTASQRLLLSYHPLDEFAVDVAKGCHHGSDDIDLRFVRAEVACDGHLVGRQRGLRPPASPRARRVRPLRPRGQEREGRSAAAAPLFD